MRLLGSNLLPFSVAQLPSTWSTGIEVEAYFFEGDIPNDLSAYYNDHRKLIADSVAASRIVLQPTADGLVLMQQYSYGVKAVYGSVYDPKLGVTIHYPKSIIPRRTNASTSTLDIDTAYATDLVTGNKKMKQHLSLGLFPGFPVGTVRQLADFVGNYTAQIATMADLVFDGVKTFDALLADDPAKANIATIQMIAQGSGAGSSTIGTTVTGTVPVNVNTNAVTALTTDILRCYGSIVNTTRRPIPVSVGDKSSAAISKTIGYAILLIPDSNFGALAVGNYDIRFMATKVGVTGAGELIELEKLTLTSGEFAEVTQVRTSAVLSPSKTVPDWVNADAAVAFDYTKFISSPTTDYLNSQFSYSGWPVNGEAIQGTKGSLITYPAANYSLDVTQSFYLEFDYRQSDVSSNAEMNLLQISTSYTDRLIISFDRSNETGLVLWNNRQTPKITRPLSVLAPLLTTSNVKVVYSYDADTYLHKLSVDGNVIDSFTYQILPITKADLTVWGVYGNSSLPTPYVNKFQIVQGKPKSNAATYAEFIAASDSLTKQDQTAAFGSVTGARAIDFTNTQSGTMWGTPYGSYFTYDSNSGVSIIHCCPDRDVFDEIAVTSKRRVVVVLQQEGTIASFASLTRNGFTSSSYGSFTALSIRKFVYWDYKLGAMVQSNPYSKSDPVAWDGTF